MSVVINACVREVLPICNRTLVDCGSDVIIRLVPTVMEDEFFVCVPFSNTRAAVAPEKYLFAISNASPSVVQAVLLLHEQVGSVPAIPLVT